MGTTLYSAARVLPGDGQTPENAGVLVDGPRIAAVGSVEELAPAASQRRGFPGGTLLPGLIDCHVHLCFDGGPDPDSETPHVGNKRTWCRRE
jgi:imidazolonepropionase-like amidohydrolase